jgi:hypothetical protein
VLGFPLLPISKELVSQLRFTKLAKHVQVPDPKWDRRDSSLFREGRTGTVRQVKPLERCAPASLGNSLGNAEQLNPVV